MKLTKTIMRLGRAVAYYPGLKALTDSTTATVFLCQILYWHDKSKTAWTWKDSNEIEEETGLTVYEQRTARKTLVDRGLIAERQDRINHKIGFMVMEDELNRQWEAETGAYTRPLEAEEAETINPEDTVPEAKVEESIEDQFKKQKPQIKADHSKVVKKGDAVDLVIDTITSAGFAKEEALKRIKLSIEKKLHINPDGKRWQNFIEYVYGREKRGEPVDVFLKWSLENGFNPVYWTPEKMQTLYPQAFIRREESDFVESLPDANIVKDDDIAPMPGGMGIKRTS